MMMTDKIRRAIRFASKTHDFYQKQKRKIRDTSYITHPLMLGILLAKTGADDDIISAGILHDTIEDSLAEKKVSREMLSERFGERVATIVSDLSESHEISSWQEKKEKVIRDISTFSDDSLLVKSADVVCNLADLLDDYARYGEEVFDHFRPPKEDKINNYIKTIDAINERSLDNPFREDLNILKSKLKAII